MDYRDGIGRLDHTNTQTEEAEGWILIRQRSALLFESTCSSCQAHVQRFRLRPDWPRFVLWRLRSVPQLFNSIRDWMTDYVCVCVCRSDKPVWVQWLCIRKNVTIETVKRGMDLRRRIMNDQRASCWQVIRAPIGIFQCRDCHQVCSSQRHFGCFSDSVSVCVWAQPSPVEVEVVVAGGPSFVSRHLISSRNSQLIGAIGRPELSHICSSKCKSSIFLWKQGVVLRRPNAIFIEKGKWKFWISFYDFTASDK
jgi:hypothetical protein